jgi:hypothetical protein
LADLTTDRALHLDLDVRRDLDMQVASPIFDTRPSTPPAMTTSSPLGERVDHALCSFWRFILGRIITK